MEKEEQEMESMVENLWIGDETDPREESECISADVLFFLNSYFQALYSFQFTGLRLQKPAEILGIHAIMIRDSWNIDSSFN